MPAITAESSPKFKDALSAIQEILTAFSTKSTEELTTVIATSFGENFNIGTLLSLATTLQAGQLTSFPTVESVPDAALDGATGAFYNSLDTIYLSETYLAEASTEDLANTLLQHLGYSIDAQINVADAPGDEGAIFAALVQDKSLNNQKLATLKSIDNTRSLTINGQVIDGEVSQPMERSAPAHDEANDDDSGSMDMFKGSNKRDRFKGDDSDNDMSGGGGKDRLIGKGGNDKMDGGGGSDRMKGGDGDDEMFGGGGRDNMHGGNGDDMLTGGGGRDKMKGGKGADQFIYEKMGDRGDTIVDFKVANDVLNLSGVLSDLGVTNSNFNQLLGDVIILGATKKGTQISIDGDGLEGNRKAQKLVFLKKVDVNDLSAGNFEL
ncbi:MAG: calcium-binding protein [Cyanobacteria bacterium P01_F01_bin.150]